MTKNIRKNINALLGILVLLILIFVVTGIVYPPMFKSKIQNNVANTNTTPDIVDQGSENKEGPSIEQVLPKKEEIQSKFSTSDPNSLWVIVNKKNPLPERYIPTNLDVPNVSLHYGKTSEFMKLKSEAATALEAMFSEARKAGFRLILLSGYRSEKSQEFVYNDYLLKMGSEEAEKVTAKPRYSEHQTGLAADVGRTDLHCMLERCFENTSEGLWLREHSADFGFTMRYPKNKMPITGYAYEPWHFRYVGKDLAKKLKDENKTMEEEFAVVGN